MCGWTLNRSRGRKYCHYDHNIVYFVGSLSSGQFASFLLSESSSLLVYRSRSPSASTLSHSLSVLMSPDVDPGLLLFRKALSRASVGILISGLRGGSTGFPSLSAASVSVPLSSLLLSFISFLSSLICFVSLSFSFAACSSFTNQLIANQSPAHKTDSTTKWMLYVRNSKANSTSWSAAKDALVATTSVGVGPGVKTEDQRLLRKFDIWVLVEMIVGY